MGDSENGIEKFQNFVFFETQKVWNFSTMNF